MTGKELKANRVSKGWTQFDLAEKIGVSKNTVINYEKGKTIPNSKGKLLSEIFDLGGKTDFTLENKLKIINTELTKRAIKQDNPSRYILAKVLDQFHPIEIVDYLDGNREVFFKIEEFKMLAKNLVGANDIENLKDEIKRINKRLDNLS